MKLKYNIFDFNFEKPIKKLIKEANKRFKDKYWTLSIVCCDDNDLIIKLINREDDGEHQFSYKKSRKNQFIYWYDKYVPAKPSKTLVRRLCIKKEIL